MMPASPTFRSLRETLIKSTSGRQAADFSSADFAFWDLISVSLDWAKHLQIIQLLQSVIFSGNSQILRPCGRPDILRQGVSEGFARILAVHPKLRPPRQPTPSKNRKLQFSGLVCQMRSLTRILEWRKSLQIS